MFERPTWIKNNTLNGCGCNGNSSSTARTASGTGLLFNPDPLVTVGVSFSREETIKLGAALFAAVVLGTIIGNKILS